MGLIRKFSFFVAVLSTLSTFNAHANVIVTWQDDAGDLVIRWDGFLSNWAENIQGNTNVNTTSAYLEKDVGLHAVSGNVDYILSNSSRHDWFVGYPVLLGGVLAGDSFGSGSGVAFASWVYMPGNYQGEVISGSATFLGAGNYVGLGAFNAGFRDLGFGDNDKIIFEAYQVSEPAQLFSLGLLCLVLFRLRIAKLK
jgi:hypothetical protein